MRLKPLLLACFLLLPSYSFALPNQGTVERVVDGDTLRIRIDNKSFPVRLTCIDSPEHFKNDKLFKDAARSHQSIDTLLEGGELSIEFLRGRIKKGDTVRIEYGPNIFDPFGRVLGYVFLKDGTFINRLMVQEGYAGVLCYAPQDQYAAEFLKTAETARNKGKGLWGKGMKLTLFWKKHVR